MFLFKSKPKTPAELVKKCRETLQALEKEKSPPTKLQTKMTKYLSDLKGMMYGLGEGNEPTPENIDAAAKAILSEEMLPLLIRSLAKLEFEARKDAVLIFGKTLRRQQGQSLPAVEYLTKNPGLVRELVVGYATQEIAMTCGAMLRECLAYESLTGVVLRSDEFWNFFEYAQTAAFDVSGDALSTFKELLTRHKPLVADFLDKNYDRFFEHYTRLLGSENYVTKRQSVKLLGELLLDRANFAIMQRYISDVENLKLMMKLLVHKSRPIQFEAFHVFKVFVANPNKAQPIKEVLLANRDQLVSYLTNFHNDHEDEQFSEEKAFIIKSISALEN